MSAKLSWQSKAAKRDVAEAALRRAVAVIEDARPTGAARSYHTSEYKVALYLIRIAERELRVSEGDRS